MTFKKMDNSFTNLLKKVGKGMFGFLVIFILLYIVITLVAPTYIIKIFKYQNFVITSGSMDPVLKYGDIVVAKKIDPSKLEVEDIVTFYVDFNLDGKKEVVTHYLAQITINEDRKYMFRTHAENRTVFDSWLLEEDDIIGIKAGHIKSVGKIVLYIQSGFGLGIFIVDLIIIYLIVQIMNSMDSNYSKDKYTKNKELARKL